MSMKRVILAGVVPALLFGAGLSSWAQQVPNNYQDKPAGPQSLPGDNLPPFMMLDASGKLKPSPPTPPGGFHPPDEGGKLESTAAGPGLDLAIAGAQAALAECRRLGSHGSVSVVDIAGDARAMLTSDGTDGSHIFVAQRKALTALQFGMPSIKVKELAQQGDPAILARITPNMFVQFGGYPLISQGRVIGAIGYSGGADEPCAKAGWSYIQDRLPH